MQCLWTAYGKETYQRPAWNSRRNYITVTAISWLKIKGVFRDTITWCTATYDNGWDSCCLTPTVPRWICTRTTCNLWMFCISNVHFGWTNIIVCELWELTFWRHASPPSSGYKIRGRRPTWAGGCRLKMKVIRSSETSVYTRSTWHHIPEDSNLHNHRCENLKS
jgi:hypothetical protein